MVFIPHGMDLIFDRPDLPLDGGWSGTVARAFMETPEGRSKYLQRLAESANWPTAPIIWRNVLRACPTFFEPRS